MLPEISWSAIISAITAAYAVILLALTEYFRKKFFTREDALGMIKRFEREDKTIADSCERISKLVFSMNDRLIELDKSQATLTERYSIQWKQLSAELAKTAETLQQVSGEMNEISRRLERIQPR